MIYFQGLHSPSLGHGFKRLSTVHPDNCLEVTFHHMMPPVHFGPSIIVTTAPGGRRPRTLPVYGSARITSRSVGLIWTSRPTASLSEIQRYTWSSLPSALSADVGSQACFFGAHFSLGSGHGITHRALRCPPAVQLPALPADCTFSQT